jgi:hypothetical protein
MKNEPTLKERAGQLYRRLLLLHRLFRSSDEEADWMDAGDKGRGSALRAAVRDVLDELVDHAQVLTAVPLPISDWRPGDGPQDERWRALTDLERREILSILSAYGDLISWSEGMVRRALTVPPGADGRARNLPQDMREAAEYLTNERVRLDRIRGEVSFLQRRRNGETAPGRLDIAIEETMWTSDQRPRRP